MMTMFPQIFFPEANRELQYLHLIAAPSNSRSLRRSLASGMEADDVPPARAPAAPASPPPRAEAPTATEPATSTSVPPATPPEALKRVSIFQKSIVADEDIDTDPANRDSQPTATEPATGTNVDPCC